MLCYAVHVLCFAVPCCTMIWYDMSCRVVSCRVVSCRVVSCRVMSCHVMSCHVMLSYVIFLLILYYCSLPWPAEVTSKSSLGLTNPQGKSSYTPVPLAWIDPSICCSDDKQNISYLFLLRAGKKRSLLYGTSWDESTKLQTFVSL